MHHDDGLLHHVDGAEAPSPLRGASLARHAACDASAPKGRCLVLDLLWVLAGVLLLMWVIGLSVSVNVGAVIHVLLVLAVVSILIRIILGRRAL